MNKNNIVISILFILITGFQSVISSDDDCAQALINYANRPCVKVLCCNPQGCGDDSVWMKCDTADHAINSSLNVTCCVPRCLLGSLCCACFGIDLACFSLQEIQASENKERDIACGSMPSDKRHAKKNIDQIFDQITTRE